MRQEINQTILPHCLALEFLKKLRYYTTGEERRHINIYQNIIAKKRKKRIRTGKKKKNSSPQTRSYLRKIRA